MHPPHTAPSDPRCCPGLAQAARAARLALLALVPILALAACTAPSPTPAGIEKTIFVGPELVDCVGVAPQQCMQIKENPEGEYTLFYGTIEGFEFEPGYTYELRVLVTEVPNPPADSSSLKYSLIEELSKTPAAPSPEPATASSTGGPTETEQVRFDPLSIPLRPEASALPASCAPSVIVPREGAYQCTTESGGVLDPCFEVAAGTLGCHPNPKNGMWQAGPLSVTGTLPENPAPAAEPVAFALDLGPQQPLYTKRAEPKPIEDLQATWDGQAPGAFIVGELDTRNPLWIAQRITTSSDTSTVSSGPTPTEVLVAWTY